MRLLRPTLLCALALLMLPEQLLLAVCPGGGGGGRRRARRPVVTRRERNTDWIRWWDAHRELYFTVVRKADPNQGGDQDGGGSAQVKYTDPLRGEVIKTLSALAVDTRAHRTARLQAVLSLGKIGGEKQTELLKRVFEKDEARDVRIHAVLGIGLLRRPENAEWLTAVFTNKSNDEVMRHYAAVGVGMIGRFEHAEPLMKMFARSISGNDRGVALGALVGLSYIKDPKVAELAGKLLLDGRRHRLVRVMAAHCLARQASKDVLPIFAKHHKLRKPDDAVDQAIALALGHLDDATGACAQLRFLVEKRKDTNTRSYALLSLARHRDPEQTEFLIKQLDKFPRDARSFAALACGVQGDAAAVEPLRKYCKKHKNDSGGLGAGLVALGLLKDRDYLHKTWLTEKTFDKQRRDATWIRCGLTALALIGADDKAKRFEKAYLEQMENATIACEGAIARVMLGEPPLSLLDELTREGKSKEQPTATLALGETASRDAAKPLMALAADYKERDRQAMAARALGHLFDRDLEQGTMRQLSQAYLYDATELDKCLRHLFVVP